MTGKMWACFWLGILLGLSIAVVLISNGIAIHL